MKAKGGTKAGGETRYRPVDESTYPEVIEHEGYEYHRFWCRPLFVVYEKYKNSVRLGYLIVPGEKEVFQFQTMVNYAESIRAGETMCVPYVPK